jgi:phospholipase C
MAMKKKLWRRALVVLAVMATVIGTAAPVEAAARATDDSCPPGVVPSAGFADVPASDVHLSSIDCMVWWRVANGTTRQTYNPTGQVNRGQMASFIARTIDATTKTLPDATADHFADDNGTSHEANINRLAEAGIVSGRSDGTYGPNDPVTRGQMATFLVNAYEFVGPALTSSRDYFDDDNGTTHEDDINKSAEAGFAGGRADGTYGPNDVVVRDQMASFLARLLDLLVEGGFASTSSAGVHVGHVFIIELENKGFDKTWGAGSPATYLNGTLRPQGQLLSQYYGIGHASLDNYIAEVSGQAPNPDTQADCGTFKEFESTGTGDFGQELGQGCVYPTNVKTIADQLDAAGKTWKAYQEDIQNAAPAEPATCRHPAIGSPDPTLGARPTDMYATRHNPFMYFHTIIDNQAECDANVVGFDAMGPDFGSEATTPNYSFITPNLCHDGHDTPCVNGEPGGLVSSDQMLQNVVPPVLASPAFQNDGLLIITFDEADGGESSACCNTPPSPNAAQPGGSGPGGGRVGALLIGPQVAPGTQNVEPYNHYSMLCSVENIFGLERLGFAGVPGLTCFGNDVFARP